MSAQCRHHMRQSAQLRTYSNNRIYLFWISTENPHLQIANSSTRKPWWVILAT